MSDTPFANPWSDAPDSRHKYLTFKSQSEIPFELKINDPTIFHAKFTLDDTKVVRTRTVYNLITLVSEVSGFADIFLVIIGFGLGVMYTS